MLENKELERELQMPRQLLDDLLTPVSFAQSRNWEIWEAGYLFGCIESAYRNDDKILGLENRISDLELVIVKFKQTFNAWPYRGAK